MTQPATSSRELTGTSFGDYRILRRLGRGAMADVYLAEQRSLGRQVALKILKDELARDEKSLRRFRNEATAAAALVHANIVQIYEVGDHEGLYYIAQEYVSGGTVGDLMRKDVSLDPRTVIAILRQSASALACAAQEGIVHRDIKPENLLLARTGEVKVADFGLARAAAREGVDLTQAGVAMGTPLYMSPEQIEGRDLGPASDIYSLGVSAYHMLVGRPPFTGDTPLAVAVQHLNSQPSRIETHRTDVPPGLARIIHKMLAKKPAERYGGGRELLADLRTLAKDIGGDADWEEWSTSEMLALAGDRNDATGRLGKLMKTSTLLESRRPRRFWLIACGVLAACLGVVLGLSLRREILAAESGSSIDEQANEWAQLYHAKVIDTPAAWQSIKDHFPKAEAYFHHLADLGLAFYYLRKELNYELSLQIFEKLAMSSEEEFSASGLAGMIIIKTHQGDRAGRNDAWEQLISSGKYERLPREIRREVIDTMERDRAQLSAQHQNEVEARMRELESGLPDE